MTDSDAKDPQRRPTVLVIDDEPSVRESMRLFLEASGYGAIEAETVERAVELLRTAPVNAVILDVRLAGNRSGLEVLARIRLKPALSEIPVLILTGGILTEDEERLITRERAHLFYKPEGYDTLVDFLDQLTGRNRSH